MQMYDIAMLVVLLGATIFGAWKGMAWQLASLSSIFFSFAVALRFSPQVAPLVGAQEPWNRFVAMLILYLGTSLAIWLIFRLIAGMIDRIKLKDFDRQMGALFGAAKGVVLCIAITFFAVTLSKDAREMALHSRSGRYISVFIDRASPVMPKEVHDVLGPYLDKLEQGLNVEDHSRESEDPAERTATKIRDKLLGL